MDVKREIGRDGIWILSAIAIVGVVSGWKAIRPISCSIAGEVQFSGGKEAPESRIGKYSNRPGRGESDLTLQTRKASRQPPNCRTIARKSYIAILQVQHSQRVILARLYAPDHLLQHVQVLVLVSLPNTPDRID